MHCDMLKIQDGGAIVEKLNCQMLKECRHVAMCLHTSQAREVDF